MYRGYSFVSACIEKDKKEKELKLSRISFNRE
jgi:hypothetical protein